MIGSPAGAHHHNGRIAHLRRYREIASVLVVYGFADVVARLHLTPYVAAGRRFLSIVGHEVRPERTRAERLRLACEATPLATEATMGPIRPLKKTERAARQTLGGSGR